MRPVQSFINVCHEVLTLALLRFQDKGRLGKNRELFDRQGVEVPVVIIHIFILRLQYSKDSPGSVVEMIF